MSWPSMLWIFVAMAARLKQVGSGTLDEFVEDVRGFLDVSGLAKGASGQGTPWEERSRFNSRLPIRDRVSSLVMIASAGLGSEIDGEYIEGFISAGRRKDLLPQIEKLFADRKLVTRQLVENVLKFKRMDGVESSLRAIATQFCPGRTPSPNPARSSECDWRCPPA